MKKLFLLIILFQLSQAVHAQDECGTWRWRVKLLLDRSGIDWGKTKAEPATITEFCEHKDTPDPYRLMDLEDSDLERQPLESRKIKMTCYVYDVRVNEKDMEYRLLLSVHKDGTGDKMCAFIPNPRCSSLNRYPDLKRKYADARYVADDIKSWNDRGYVVKVDLVGMPFWGLPNKSKAYAPNGVEIHPVTKLKAYLPQTAGKVQVDE